MAEINYNFGGPQQTKGGGIMDVKLSPSQMRFPTARRPASRQSTEPDLTEKLAPLLPFLVEGLGGLFSKDPEKLTDQAYLDSIGGMVEDPVNIEDVQANRKAEAKLNAYKTYGEPTERQGFGMRDIVDLLAAGSLGRGGDDYAKSAVNLRTAKEKSRLVKETNRSNFLTSALKDVDNLQYKVFEDIDTAKVGIDDYRSGFVDPRGESYVMNDDKTGYTNIKNLDGSWIEQKYKPTTSLSSQMKNPVLVELTKKDAEINAKDTALLGTITLVNEAVGMFNKGIADPKQNALTSVTSIGNLLNSAKSNFNQIGSYIGKGDVLNAFATSQDIQNGIGGSDGRQGSGQLAKQLYEAIQSDDDELMIAAMNAFEQGNEGFSFKQTLGDMAYNNVRTRAVMLQLAYSAAAANGQTGRTLSDKDLAFHLQMIGFGSTQDSQTAKDNLLTFADTLLRSTDNTIQGAISQNSMDAGRYPLNDKMFTSIIGGYWIPEVIDGEKQWQSPNNYTFKGFTQRYSKIADVINFQKHTRRDGSTFNSEVTTNKADPSTTLDEDLEELGRKY